VAAALALAFGVFGLLSQPAGAKSLEVKPGKNAVQKAVDRARPGDVLRVREGRYREVVVIDERIKLWGVDSARPTIDGACSTNITLAVTHPGVVLKHLKVVGAVEGFGHSPSQVDFRFLGRGMARDLVLRETCGSAGSAAEYGINLLATKRVEIHDSVAKGGHTDAGIYLGGIDATGSGATIVKGNQAFDNTVGIVVEQSHGDIRVLDNQFFRNSVPGVQDSGGIFVNFASGALFAGNSITDNGLFGVDLTAGSDNNVFNDNVITGNESDVIDAGVGSCGSGNTIGAGPQIPAC